MSENKPKVIELGSNETVILDKLFGPTVFADLRITANTKTGNWMIERQWIKSGEWFPWVEIPGQIAEEFTEQD